MLEDFDETLGYCQDMFKQVAWRLAHNDTKMIAEHARRSDLEKLDIRTAFLPGDLCLLRAPSAGKLKRQATGTFTFVRYVGHRGVNAEIVGVQGTLRMISLVNLCPLDHQMHINGYRAVVEEGRAQE